MNDSLSRVFKEQLYFTAHPGFGRDSDTMEVDVFYNQNSNVTDLFIGLNLYDMKKLEDVVKHIIYFMELER